MNINKALKQKNQLIGEIKELKETISENNSIIVGNEREFDIFHLIEELDTKVAELVKLKSAIQKANVPILDKIYLLSETKSYINWLKSIPVESGKQKARYGDAIEQTMEVVLNKKDVRETVKKLEKEISEFQDEVDTFNATTEVIL